MKSIQSRVSVARAGKVLGEYAVLQLPSLFETGHLSDSDCCLDEKCNEWIPLGDFLQRVPGYSKRSRQAAPNESPRSRGKTNRPPVAAWVVVFGALVLSFFLGLLAWKQQGEIAGLQARLSAAEATNAEAKEKYQKVLFASREVAESNLVRGRVILRDASGKRVSLPGIKIRIYPRAQIESHLAARHESVAQAGGTDLFRLATHFLKGMPDPLETTSTDSDGRFELKVPEPGEYVLQTGIRSAKTGEMRVWFVTFDSRDALNTPVDITESNVVRQFNPLLMLVGGR
jgi:hypothetical protein